MGLQELFQAMQMFKQGAQEYGIQQGISAANDQVQQLKAAQMDEMQKRSALQEISNGLTMHLAGLGAPATTVAAAAGAIAPAPIKDSADALLQGTKTGSLKDLVPKLQEAEFDKTKRTLDLQGEWDLKKQKLANEAVMAKQSRTIENQDIKSLDALTKNFNSNAKKYLEAIEQARTARDILQSGNPIGDQAIGSFMARASQEVGNLTAEERAPYGSAQDLRSRLAQTMQTWKEGKLTDENRKFLIDLANTYDKSGNRAARSYADRMSKQYGKIHGKDPEMIRSYIFPEQDQEQSGQPSGEVKTYRKKDGTTFKGIKLPDGRIQVVE